VAGTVAIVLILRLMPSALHLPSVAQLRAVNAELRLLSEAVEQSTNMVIITDPSGVIEYVNPRFSEVSGYDRAAVLGLTPAVLASGSTPPETYAAMWAALTAGRPWSGELQDRHRDGSPFWVAATISPVRDEAGRVSHFVAMQDDITERKRNEQSLREARELAEIANRAKSQLLANMSHELRTPLNAIIGFSSVLQSGVLGAPANPKHAEYLNDIQSSGQHLLSLINDILDVSAIEVGKLNLNEEAISLDEVVGSVVRMVQSRAEQGEVVVAVTGAPAPAIHADARRLKQIVANLLTNAVKFTPPGGRVTIRKERDDAGGVVLEVVDTGIGMSAEELSLAMQPFSQVDSSLARRQEGTGLGLPLTKGLVEAHGGRLEILSAKGHGTLARVHLPAERVLSHMAAQ
jgi:PAS domain S-box-containing protein